MTNVVDVYINYLRRKVDFGPTHSYDPRGWLPDRRKLPGPGSSRLPVQKFRVFVSYTYCIVYFILDLAQSSKDAPEGNFFPTVVFYVSRSYKCIVPIG